MWHAANRSSWWLLWDHTKLAESAAVWGIVLSTATSSRIDNVQVLVLLTEPALGKENVQCIIYQTVFIFFKQCDGHKLRTSERLLQWCETRNLIWSWQSSGRRSQDAVNLNSAVKKKTKKNLQIIQIALQIQSKVTTESEHVIQTWSQVDTVKVAVFDPQKVRGTVADHWRRLSLLFSLHQDGHEVVDFIHVHVSHIVTAD